MNLDDFITIIDDFSSIPKNKQVDYFAYYFNHYRDQHEIQPKEIDSCFLKLFLKPYSRTVQYLSEESRKSNGKYIKVNSGYHLERSYFDEIKSVIENEPQKITISEQLSKLRSKIVDTQEKTFFDEAINCYRVQSNRATIVMVWVLIFDHLLRFIFSNKLNEFNVALSKNPDKKVNKIINLEDFSDLQESKIIELSRSAKIITNDVRKILEEKLGIRNSAAHPSGVSFSSHKTTEFILDLIVNVLLKY